MADLTVKGDATNGSKRYKITFAEGSGTKENPYVLGSGEADKFKEVTLIDLGNSYVELPNFYGPTYKLKTIKGGHYIYNLNCIPCFASSNLESFSSDISENANCSNMFSNCEKLTAFTSDTSKVVSAWSMFNDCASLKYFEGDLSSIFVDEENNRNGAGGMFWSCSNLEEVRITTTGDNASVFTKENLSVRDEAHLYVNGVEVLS